MQLIQKGPWGILNPSESQMNQRYTRTIGSAVRRQPEPIPQQI